MGWFCPRGKVSKSAVREARVPSSRHDKAANQRYSDVRQYSNSINVHRYMTHVSAIPIYCPNQLERQLVYSILTFLTSEQLDTVLLDGILDQHVRVLLTDIDRCRQRHILTENETPMDVLNFTQN